MHVMDNTDLDRDAFDGLGFEHVQVDLAGDDVALVEDGEGSGCWCAAAHCECQPFEIISILERYGVL